MKGRHLGAKVISTEERISWIDSLVFQTKPLQSDILNSYKRGEFRPVFASSIISLICVLVLLLLSYLSNVLCIRCIKCSMLLYLVSEATNIDIKCIIAGK